MLTKMSSITKRSRYAAIAVLAIHILFACFLVARCIIIMTNTSNFKQPLSQKVTIIESNASAIAILLTLLLAIIGTLAIGFYLYYSLITKAYTLEVLISLKDKTGRIERDMRDQMN